MDLISRQAAIDAVSRGCYELRGVFAECEKNLNELPSVQSEPSQVARDIATIINNEKDMRVVLENSEPYEAAKRLSDLIFDINPAEICSQIESDNLKQWCKIIQTEMRMAMVQLPCWAEKEN